MIRVDFIDPDQDEVINSKNPEVYDGFSELPVLPECHFTDVSCHYSNADTSRTVKFESDVEPRIYWIRKDLGTLGYINIGDDVRVVLLRGLKKPKNIEVVDHRVYWLEEGDEWQYNGRICFLDTFVNNNTSNPARSKTDCIAFALSCELIKDRHGYFF